MRSCQNKNPVTNQKRKRASVSCSPFLENHHGKGVIPNTSDDIKNLTERMVNWIGKQEKFNAALVTERLQGKNAKDTFAITVRNYDNFFSPFKSNTCTLATNHTDCKMLSLVCIVHMVW